MPESGPVIAPLYEAATIDPSSLSGPLQSLQLRWTIPNRCLCRAMLRVSDSHASEEWLIYSADDIPLSALQPKLWPGTYALTLVCYPELATVDDVLTGDRAKRFSEGVGRLARVQTEASIVVR